MSSEKNTKQENIVCESFDTQYAIYNGNRIDAINYAKIEIQFQGELFCSNGHELKFIRSLNNKFDGTPRKAYFRHKYSIDYNPQPETTWHNSWKNIFDEPEKTYKKNNEMYKGRRADVNLNDEYVIEFQHSKISKKEVNERKSDYESNKKSIIWIIDGDDSIKVNKINDNYDFLEFDIDKWKYKSFIEYQYIFVDIDNNIYKVFPKYIKKHIITVNKPYRKDDFIKMLKSNDNEIHVINIPSQCTIYYIQRGAGNGKTFECVQLPKKYSDKTTLIYLSKAHTAKKIIYDEFKKQYKNNTEFNELKNGKKYKISYKDENKHCNILIATVDSFNNINANLDKLDNSDRDYFVNIMNTIINGDINNKSYKYADTYIRLNKKCLIVIDEAQDLPKKYLDSMYQLMKESYCDLYIIGDKLQSIYHIENIFTTINNTNTELVEYKITLDKDNIQPNIVKRFHEEEHMHFANTCINFNKYELNNITGICKENDCDMCIQCKINKQNNIKPINFIQMSQLHEYDEQMKFIDNIIENINNEVNINKLLPEDILFIFPYIKGNILADNLRIRLTEFWILKMTDENYIHNVINKNDYWRDNINEHKDYVVLHSSDDGRSINLKESEHSVRLVSIHASKGDGRKVVFLLQMTEKNLRIYSGDNDNIKYESLLHVALTRQKMIIYIGYEYNGDDICMRFHTYRKLDIDNMTDDKCISSISEIKNMINYSNVIDYSYNTSKCFNDIKTIINFNEYDKFDYKDTTEIVDLSHHLIRYCMLRYYLLQIILNTEQLSKIKENNTKGDETTFICVKKIVVAKIIECDGKEYIKQLYHLGGDNIERVIPVLHYKSSINKEYEIYYDILCCYIEHIKGKLNYHFKKYKKYPKLCPLETVIFLHLIEIIKSNINTSIRILDVYKVLKCFYKCYGNVIDKHDEEYNEDNKYDDNPNSNKYRCLCGIKFNNCNQLQNNKYDEIMKTIGTHYIKTTYELICKLYKIYDNNMTEYKLKYDDKSITYYNISHKIHSFDNELNIYDKFDIIGYSDKLVIHFIITPQFNKLKYNEIITNCIMDKYMIMNCNKHNKDKYERFSNKEVIGCIFTLDSEIPLICNLNINRIDNKLNNCITSSLINIYAKNSYLVYTYIIKNIRQNNKISDDLNYIYNKINGMITKLKNIRQESNNNNKIPIYIIDYLKEIIDNKHKEKSKYLIKLFNEPKKFIENLDDYIMNKFDGYQLNIYPDDEIIE